MTRGEPSAEPRRSATAELTRRTTLTKFIQVCASQNDLFALDEEGDVYQYHFDVKSWVKLSATRATEKRRTGGPEPGR